MKQKGRAVGKILGVSITGTNLDEVLRKVESSLKSKKKLLIVTPNPENVLKAQSDYKLKEILNKADISLADGVGLIAWYRFLGLPNPRDPLRRLLTLFVQALGVSFSIFFNQKWLFYEFKPAKGRDLVLKLVELANNKRLKVFLLGGEHSQAKRAQRRMEMAFPGILITSFQGPILGSDLEPVSDKDRILNKKAISLINDYCPDILVVCMSCPKQERWLYRYLPKISVKVGIGAGGTFKYLAGDVPLPPKWIDSLNLAWLWRLITGDQQPERIWRSTIEFPVRVFIDKLKSGRVGE